MLSGHISNNPTNPQNNNPTKEVGGQSEAQPSILEEIQKSNMDMEQLLETLGDPPIECFMLERPFRKEFKEPFSIATIVLCPREMKTLKLILRNMTNQSPTAVYLSPYLDKAHQARLEKGKNPMLNHPPPLSDLMNLTI